MKKQTLHFLFKKQTTYWFCALHSLFASYGSSIAQSIPSNPPSVNIIDWYQDGTYVFDDTVKIMRDDLFTFYKRQFGLGPNDKMVLTETIRTDSMAPERVGIGNYASTYDQYHKGYKVIGCRMNVLGQFNVALRVSGFIMEGLDVDVSNPISEHDALQVALTDIGAATYLWEDKDVEDELLEMDIKGLTTFYPKGRLEIRRINQGTKPSDYKLCWVFTVKTADPVGGIFTRIIDAITGDILETPETYFGFYHWGNVETPHNGLKDIQTKKCLLCSNYSLSGPDDLDIGYYVTLDGYGTYKIAKDPTNYWSSTDDTRTTATAYWIGSMSRAFYFMKYGRWTSNYDGKSIWVRGNIIDPTLSSAGYTIHEDRWDEISMRPDYSTSVAATDIISHEVSHGYIKHHTDLGLYNDFDARSILEGFCDIFGHSIETFVKGSPDWMFGHEAGDYTRYFHDPHWDTPLESPSTYLEPGYWYPPSSGPAGWYRNSGILRKWFYRMSTRSDDNLGINLATDIAYLTVNWWVWVNLSWPELANQSRLQAIHDYGLCSKNYRGIVKSWKDVGLLTTAYTDCIIVPLRGWNVVRLGQEEEIRFTPELDDPDIPGGGTFDYEVPDTWITYRDGNDLVVTGFTGYESRKLKFIYTAPNNEVFENEKVMHIVSDDVDVNYSHMEQSFMSFDPPEEKQYSDKAIVYPNPAGNSITLMLPLEVEGATLSLTDIQGRSVYNQQISGLHINVNLPALPSGIYILQVNAKNLNTVNRIQINQK